MERCGIDEVHERPLAGDLDHWKPLAVLRLELGIARDVDLVERVTELRREHGARVRAQVAPVRVEQDDLWTILHASRTVPGTVT
jgi:hypothetical protein